MTNIVNTYNIKVGDLYMENENKKELMRIFYKNKVFNKLAIGALLIGIFLFAIGIIINSRALPTATALKDVTSSNIYAKDL